MSASSPRRLAQQGIQWHYKLNPETPRWGRGLSETCMFELAPLSAALLHQLIESSQTTVCREIELILLDERYERSPLPCQVRDEYCLKEVRPAFE